MRQGAVYVFRTFTIKPEIKTGMDGLNQFRLSFSRQMMEVSLSLWALCLVLYSSTGVFGQHATWSQVGDRQISCVFEAQTWHDAHAICMLHGGHIAIDDCIDVHNCLVSGIFNEIHHSKFKNEFFTSENLWEVSYFEWEFSTRAFVCISLSATFLVHRSLSCLGSHTPVIVVCKVCLALLHKCFLGQWTFFFK